MADPNASVEDLLILNISERQTEEIINRVNLQAEDSGSQVRTGGAPPAVSGLTLVSASGSIVVRWNASSAQDVVQYEVQFATEPWFPSPVTKATAGTTFEWSEGVAGQIYYVRVRAVNRSGTPGPYDLVVNTASGFVQSTNLALGAATAVHTFVKASGFTALTGAGTTTETYGPVYLTTIDGNAVILPFVIFSYLFSSTAGADNTLFLTFELLRRQLGGSDSVIDSAVLEITTSMGTTTSMISPSFTTFDVPPSAGTWEYRVRVTLTDTGAGSIAFQGSKLIMEFVQLKR